MLHGWPRLVQLNALVEEILEDGPRLEVVVLLALVASWRVLVCDRAKALRGERILNGPGARTGNTVLMSVAPNPEQRLLAPDEAAALAGPSFTAKRLYRLRGSMPEQAWIRKGGRLYFREGPYRRWLATR